MKNKKNHKWTFFKAGGTLQPVIESGADIASIASLDNKLWSALSCPTRGIYFDTKTLDFIDTDADGRIRRDEVVSACDWTCSLLKNPNTLLKASESLELADIDDSTPAGKSMLSCAKEVLSDIGKADANSISVADFSDRAKIFADTPFNADGVITTLSCGQDTELANILSDIAKVCQTSKDRSGIDGINKDAIEKFFADAAAVIEWNAKPLNDASILPLAENTSSACDAYSAVAEKIDDFFTRTAVFAYDANSQAVLNAQVSQIEKIFTENQHSVLAQLESLPIAKIDGSELPLHDGINPAFSAKINAFVANTARPILSSELGEKLTYENWQKIKSTIAPYIAWMASKPTTDVATLGVERLSSIPTEAKEKLLALIDEDMAHTAEVDSIDNLEKLVRFNRYLVDFLKNFVNFEKFYNSGNKMAAAFQYGKLYIDSRACGLCVKVENVGAHSTLATASYGYIIYCTCKRKGEADINIAAVITAGEADSLSVGRNGIFYDRDGKEWDASIAKIIQNPIGIGQAFWSPYKRIVKWASEQIAKQASAADSKVVSNITTTPASPKADKKIDIGTVAALGVAVGGITTAFGMILDAFLSMGYLIPLGIIGVILAISLPSMIIASLKLRMRSIAPLLDGNGWAVNSRASVSVLFGTKLTEIAHPKKRKFGKGKVIALIVAIIAMFGGAWYFNALEKPFGLTAPKCSPYAPKCEAKAQVSAPTQTPTPDTKK